MSPAHDPKKFDPARAAVLNSPERELFLPNAAIVELLQLSGGETVLDYGAGTGRLSVAVAGALLAGRVVAVEESEQMLVHLQAATASLENVQALLISDNELELPDQSIDRILAVNLLHEIRGESALRQMRRVLKPDGRLLVIDWERGRRRQQGPPDEHLYSLSEAEAQLQEAGLAVQAVDEPRFPYHFTLFGRHRARRREIDS